MRRGKIFIYPTDTIYGLGCNALVDNTVVRIRELKRREKKPFSVIVPSKEWIHENCMINGQGEELLAMLPGAYTLIVRLRKMDCVSSTVALGRDTLGVRIPDHWISSVIKELGVPFVTTSVNISG